MMKWVAVALVIFLLGCVGGSPPSTADTKDSGSAQMKCPPGSSGITQFKGKDYCKTSATKDGKPQTSYIAPDSIGDASKMDMWIVGTNSDGQAYEVHYQANKPAETYINGELQ